MGVRFSFANCKGGVGKTTLACLFGSAIHYRYKNLNVGIIDVDPLLNTFRLRDEESSVIESDINKEALKLAMDALDKAGKSNIYPIIRAPYTNYNIEELLPVYEKEWTMTVNGKEVVMDPLDFIIVETPGSTEKIVREIYQMLDVVFVPFNTTDFVLNSTELMLKQLQSDTLENKGSYLSQGKVALIQTMYPHPSANDRFSRMERETFKVYTERFKKEFGVDVLKNVLYNAPEFKNIRSTNKDSGIGFENFVNTLSAFPETDELSSVSPYPLINEIHNYLIKLSNV